MGHTRTDWIGYCRAHRLPRRVEVWRWALLPRGDDDEMKRVVNALADELLDGFDIDIEADPDAQVIGLHQYAVFAERFGYDPEIAEFLKEQGFLWVVKVRARPPLAGPQFSRGLTV